METESNKNSFTLKDAITLTIAAAAFVLSVITFYFHNYRIDDNLRARVTNTFVLSNQYESSEVDTAIVQVAFVNGGNRQAIVLEPWILFAEKTKGIRIALPAMIENGNDFPVILQPHEMKIVSLKTSSTAFSKSNSKQKTENTPTSEYDLAIGYFSLDSKAKKHKVYGEFTVHLITEGRKINDIKEIKNLNEYNSAELFNDNKSNYATIGSP